VSFAPMKIFMTFSADGVSLTGQRARSHRRRRPAAPQKARAWLTGLDAMLMVACAGKQQLPLADTHIPRTDEHSVITNFGANPLLPCLPFGCGYCCPTLHLRGNRGGCSQQSVPQGNGGAVDPFAAVYRWVHRLHPRLGCSLSHSGQIGPRTVSYQETSVLVCDQMTYRAWE
jgi:hypothetical protein